MRASANGTGSPSITMMRLSPLDDLGQVLLHHHRLRAVAVQRLDDAAEVQPVFADAKDALAAHAVERLQDDVAVLGVKAPDLAPASRVTSVGPMYCGNSSIASFSG